MYIRAVGLPADASGKHGELVVFFDKKVGEVVVYKLFAKDKPIAEAKEEFKKTIW